MRRDYPDKVSPGGSLFLHAQPLTGRYRQARKSSFSRVTPGLEQLFLASSPVHGNSATSLCGTVQFSPVQRSPRQSVTGWIIILTRTALNGGIQAGKEVILQRVDTGTGTVVSCKQFHPFVSSIHVCPPASVVVAE